MHYRPTKLELKDVLKQHWMASLNQKVPPHAAFLALTCNAPHAASNTADLLNEHGVRAYADEGAVLVPVYDEDGTRENYDTFMELVTEARLGSQFTRIANDATHYHEFLCSEEGRAAFGDYLTPDMQAQLIQPKHLKEFGSGVLQEQYRCYYVPESLVQQHPTEWEGLFAEFRKLGATTGTAHLDGKTERYYTVTANPKSGHVSMARRISVRDGLQEFLNRHTTQGIGF